MPPIVLKEQLHEQFQQIYNNLNERQRLAVDTTEGPVMVIAGPGTGKTQILSARIANILLGGNAGPENILCLTYTDAGAVAMRKRLLSFIGAEAYKIQICTFHAFCNDIIQSNLLLFEKNSMDVVSDLERIDLLRSMIDELPRNNALKRFRGDVYYEVKNLQWLFEVMKKESWEAATIKTAIDQYIQDLPNRDEFIAKKAVNAFKKGDVRTDKIEEEAKKYERLKAAVDLFAVYQQKMLQNNWYDYSDMLLWVIRVFNEHPGILLNYQEKYQYVLVDEFQDTSGTQNKLLQQLIAFWGEAPNIFVVGDDDQSIFRFQGASIENMVIFANQYVHQLNTIVLTNNYRSTQPILDAAKNLIDNNTERLVGQLPGLSKELISSNTNINQLQHPPKVFACVDEHQQMAWLVGSIETLIAKGTNAAQIAVIYREHKLGTELMRYLQLKKIPFFSKRRLNLFDDVFIKKIIRLLDYIDAEHDVPYGGDELLFDILHFDFYQVAPIEIARLSVAADQLKYKGEITSIRKILSDKINQPPKTLFDLPLPNNLVQVGQSLEALIAAVPNCTLQKLFAQLIGQAGILSYVLQHNEKYVLMAKLNSFFDFIKAETQRNPKLTLNKLVTLLQLMQKEKLSLNFEQVAGNENGVNLLTAHGSKGLEFEHVFVAGCNSKYWEKKRKVNDGFKLPDTLFLSASKGNDLEELRRLFYVAMTRAATHLNFSYARFTTDSKPLEQTQFLVEADVNGLFEKTEVTLDQESLFEFQLLQYQQAMPELAQLEKDFVQPLLDRFVMNVTALNNYLRCPLEFYYKNLLRIPSGKSEGLEFGSAAHDALERLFKKMQDNNVFPDVDTLVNDFTQSMRRRREHFTKEQFQRRMEYGQEVLTNYYTKYIDSWNKIVSVERSIRNVVVNGVPIKGKLDKIEFEGSMANVVDYKTGDPDKGIDKTKPPSKKEPNGGDYWRQAIFYKLLVEGDNTKKWQVRSTEFDFVEPDKNKAYRKVRIEIEEKDLEIVKQQIDFAWKAIQDKAFYVGCGKSNCSWCNFVKDNNLYIALHELNEAETEAEG
jgi:DNA helicase II / ATP-dependent DNA helicase PcrA